MPKGMGMAGEAYCFLLILVFGGMNLFRPLGSKKQDIVCSKSIYYCYLSNCHYNWRWFVLLLARQLHISVRLCVQKE